MAENYVDQEMNYANMGYPYKNAQQPNWDGYNKGQQGRAYEPYHPPGYQAPFGSQGAELSLKDVQEQCLRKSVNCTTR